MQVFWQKRKHKAIIMIADNDTAVWEGKIGKKTYKAEYSGKTGEGRMLSGGN